MANFKSGVGSVLQMYSQPSWGTNKFDEAPERYLINMTSETINYTINREAEGTLLVSKTEEGREVLSCKVDGSISTILKPSFADFLLEKAMGVKSSNSYTLAETGTDLPLSGIVVRRGYGSSTDKWNIKEYPDITISKLTLTAPAQQYVTTDFDFVGTREVASDNTDTNYTFNGIDATKTSFTDKSYKCTNASLVVNGATDTCFPVESVTVTIDNGISESPVTYCSGLYVDRPTMGQRSVTVDFTIPYGSQAEAFKNAYYAINGSTVSLKLTLSNGSNTLEVSLPAVGITSYSGNVSGSDTIDCSFSGVAYSKDNSGNTVEPITVTMN